MSAAERFQGANIVDAGRLSPYWGEHAARYLFALPFVAEKSVLDIACGTGYGIGLMKETVSTVVGVDVDAEALRGAVAECSTDAAVLMADGLELPFSDESFDVVTSFETLEHIHDRPRFLDEVRRVVKPGGCLLLSTPNANYTEPVNGKPDNPFHVFEYSPSELQQELERVFDLSAHLGQQLGGGVRISPFLRDQQRLPRDLSNRSMLFAWRVMNKMPFGMREGISQMIWNKPFYPEAGDYRFSPETLDTAPVQLAVCRKK